MTATNKPVGSLSLDLDNLWSYLKIHGDPAWVDRPSYLPTFVPYMLDVLDQADLKITFFVVGIDAQDPVNQSVLQQIIARGHEIANHSYEHEPWLEQYDEAALIAEIEKTDEAIRTATGVSPIGFRGPGFSWSPALLKVLSDRGYLYDASTLPTWLGPIARMYYFWTSDLSAAEKRKRNALFGRFADGRRPLKPYQWTWPSGARLLEIPVTTMPIFRTPFHFSYLAFLARVSRPLMRSYLSIAINLCRLTNTAPSFLLHPPDVIGHDQAPALRFFPGMDMSSQEKTELMLEVLGALKQHFRLVPMSEHARLCGQDSPLPFVTA